MLTRSSHVAGLYWTDLLIGRWDRSLWFPPKPRAHSVLLAIKGRGSSVIKLHGEGQIRNGGRISVRNRQLLLKTNGTLNQLLLLLSSTIFDSSAAATGTTPGTSASDGRIRGEHFLCPSIGIEKLTALKKAYAEIILNTTKEAAVRILESERKATRFQQELSSVKEESLRMLMRMKQMLDAKDNEATVVCMSQQKKIEELEAQLEEAEDIVKELREELREVQAELEQVNTAQSQVEQRGELVAVSDAWTLCSDGPYNGSNDCSTNNSCKGDCYFQNPDFPSIIRRCKEPKLHRNGCTQRIRACEGNSCKEVQEETFKGGHEGGDQLCGTVKPGFLNLTKMAEDNSVHLEVAQSIRRRKKRSTRYSQAKATSFVNLLNHAEETRNPCFKDSQGEDKTFEQLSNASIEQSGDKDKDKGFVESQSNQAVRIPLSQGFADRTASFMNLQNHAEETQNPSCSKNPMDEDKEFIHSEIANVEQMSDKDKGFVELQVERDGNEPEEAAGLAHRTADSEKLEDASLNSELKTLDHDDVIPSQSPDAKFLKYTFQRKRKREMSCSPDPVSCVEEKNAKTNVVEKLSGSLEPKSLSFTTESSRDSRRLVQVARQVSECT
ncbi:hypothetical protein CDL15_Pgr008947 [Punica granatum]|uniref:Uncharacterized protein n=1 Tax=Punica granatum TaxID=22663 RepID=A0A218VXP1_PUNGR|nr:hypothetical protein CDL15_Pgr008947 [Punica granatum]